MYHSEPSSVVTLVDGSRGRSFHSAGPQKFKSRSIDLLKKLRWAGKDLAYVYNPRKGVYLQELDPLV